MTMERIKPKFIVLILLAGIGRTNPSTQEACTDDNHSKPNPTDLSTEVERLKASIKFLWTAIQSYDEMMDELKGNAEAVMRQFDDERYRCSVCSAECKYFEGAEEVKDKIKETIEKASAFQKEMKAQISP